MDEIITNLILENIYKEVKIKALAGVIFDNNIISKDEVNLKAQNLLKDKKFLSEELKAILPDNTTKEIFNSILKSISDIKI